MYWELKLIWCNFVHGEDVKYSNLPLVLDAQVHEVCVADRVDSGHEDLLHLLGGRDRGRPDQVIPVLPGAAGLQLGTKHTGN